VTAALAAREGITGSLDVLEGEAGFGRAMGDNPDWEKALAGLGRDFHITRMTFKNTPAAVHTFAAIDGALALQRKLNLRPEEIQRIDVSTYRAGVESRTMGGRAPRPRHASRQVRPSRRR